MTVVLCKHLDRVDLTRFSDAEINRLCTCCGHVEREPRCCP